MMISAVEEGEDYAHIPIFGTENSFIRITWGEDEDSITNFENGKHQMWCTLRCNICFDEGWRDPGDPSSTSQIIHVYKVEDENTKEMYSLLAFNEIVDVGHIRHCVALPFNDFNLVKFYKEYLMTFPDPSYE